VMADSIEQGAATKDDLRTAIAELKAEVRSAMLVQTGVIIGSIVALLKLLP
jgi:hypothetical protein